jgi:hypothetical protein
MTPSGVGSSGSLTSSGFSQAESAPSSAERQIQILADHDGASPTPAGRRTHSERQITEITLEHEEKAFI